MAVWEDFSAGWEDSPVIVMDASHVSVTWHSHTFYELVFIREGYCLHHMGDSVFLAMEGDVLFIKPGVRHKYTGTRECKIYNCLFQAESTDGLTIREFSHMHLNMRERKDMQEMLAQIKKEMQEKRRDWVQKEKFLFGCLMIECARALEERSTETTEQDVYHGHVTRALRYIDENYQRHTLTVQELGEVVGVSADYLSRQFKKVTGIGAQEYLRRYRLSRALTWLQQGYSVGEVAGRSGFHSAGYFSREFKKEMGITPSQYKHE